MGALEKDVTVARFAQGLGGYGLDFTAFEACQAFAKARQAVPARLHGLLGEVAALVEPAALAHRFLEVFGAVKFAMVDAPDFQAKAVRSQVHGG